MRAVIQKVTHAEVDVISADSRETCGRIGSGFVVLLGVTHRDTETDAKYIADKTANLRIFEDETGKLNLSLKDTGGTVLLVSQFTLYADVRNGRRPSFSDAAPAAQADELYRLVADLLRARAARRNRTLPNPYADKPVQRRAYYAAAGFAKTVLILLEQILNYSFQIITIN